MVAKIIREQKTFSVGNHFFHPVKIGLRGILMHFHSSSKRQKCFLCARMWPRPEREFTCHILNQWIQMGDVLERHDT